MDHDHQDLIALIRSRGGSLSVRQLQHARRLYRHSATDARDALASISDTGIASWSPDGRTLTLHGQPTIEPGTPPVVCQEIPYNSLPKNPDTLTGDNATGNVTAADGTPAEEEEAKRPRDRFGCYLPGPLKPKPALAVPVNGDPAPEPSAGQVVGIGVLPPTWPELPPNASLAAEVSWVQASRLDVVQQLPGGAVRVDLSRADRPAPSKGALSWLETAILFPSKFADVSVKAAQGASDDQEDARRERIAVDEAHRLLDEMAAEPAAVA